MLTRWARVLTPALLTRMSSRPARASVASTAPATESRSRTSRERANPSGNPAATLSVPAMSMSATPTAAPLSASRRAILRPISPAAPVTMATLPVRSHRTGPSPDTPGEATPGATRYPESSISRATALLAPVAVTAKRRERAGHLYQPGFPDAEVPRTDGEGFCGGVMAGFEDGMVRKPSAACALGSHGSASSFWKTSRRML